MTGRSAALWTPPSCSGTVPGMTEREQAQAQGEQDAAIALAEEEGDLGGAGVLVTGSIVTVAEARTLLGGS